MRPELSAVVRAGRLTRSRSGGPFSHTGTLGRWSVGAGLIGMGPERARAFTEQILDQGPVHHVMVVGIAGGLDPDLPVGAVMVPHSVRGYPDGAEHLAQPLGDRVARGCLMTTPSLLSDPAQWRPLAEAGVGALDMEASGVAEACDVAGVPWSVYRGISDRPDERLVDQAVFGLSTPEGGANLPAVARYVVRDPRRIVTLARLGRDMQRAARAAAEAAASDIARS
jgi:nucleoside phosphorylase